MARKSTKPAAPKPADLVPAGKIFIVLFASYAAIFLWALWGNHFDSEIFWKLSITYLVISVLVALVYLIRREFGADEQMKNDKFMD